MKSIEIIAIQDVLPDNFRAMLEGQFGTVSERIASRYITNSENVMSEHTVMIYELAYPRLSLDPISDFANSIPVAVAAMLEIKVNGESFYRGSNLTISSTSTSISPDWPTKFDIGVQTVIGKELEAAQEAFSIDRLRDAVSIDGTIFYRGHVAQNNRNVSVVVCAQNAAGNADASIFAERMIARWSPKAMFLMGICAGRRTKCKIGDVVTPRVIANDMEGVIEAKTRLKRPKIYAPPHAMIQQLQNFRYDSVRNEWLTELTTLTDPPQREGLTKKTFKESVNLKPDRHESAIYSADLLLRDADYLEDQAVSMHQQIRIGEMEAAGFSQACNARTIPTPWFVVRGVSDFGDDTKGDSFQRWASFSAASYLKILIRHGINITLF